LEFELTTLVVICGDCTGSWKSNYHEIKTKHMFLKFSFLCSVSWQMFWCFVFFSVGHSIICYSINKPKWSRPQRPLYVMLSWSVCRQNGILVILFVFFNISQSETRIALGGHVCWRNGTKWRHFIKDLIYMLSAKFENRTYGKIARIW
jgi:hypothetical protein